MKPNTVRIKAEGFNRTRLLDALAGKNIEIFDFASGAEYREFEFSVRKKDLSKTFAILQELCYNYKVQGFSRYAAIGKKLLSRLGLIVALAVFCTLAAFSRLYVWRVEITGNAAVPDKVIENVLREHNIAVGKRLSNFDSGELESAVRSIEGVKLASVSLVGATVCVEVFESEPVSPPLAYSDTDILSEYDATVTRIVTREGTALVEPGRHVFAGAPLIGAYRTDEEGNKIPSRASGTVYGKVAFTKSVVVATERYEQTAVKTEEYTLIEFFGLTVGKKPSSGAGVIITERTEKLNVFLPVSIKRVTVTQTEMRKVTVPAEELAQRVEDEFVSEFIHSRVSSGLTVSRSVRELGGGTYRVSVFITAETVISGGA